jgi:two-component system sensor histidine kinase KdpD
LAVVTTLAATGFAKLIQPYLAQTNLAMVYLLGVALVAGRHSRRAAILSAFLSVAAFDFFFVPPRRHLCRL